jgi:hypothetical protein
MDILTALKSEEKKLETRLSGIRQAIHALNDHHEPSDRVSKLKGRKLSAAHRRAIKAGIARRKAKARKT